MCRFSDVLSLRFSREGLSLCNALSTSLRVSHADDCLCFTLCVLWNLHGEHKGDDGRISMANKLARIDDRPERQRPDDAENDV